MVVISKQSAITTSLKIAEVFNKRHDNVLRAIRSLNISDQFRLLNFEECLQFNNLSKRNEPYFKINRDGCVRLIMGFSGDRAAECIERYIEAFNKMESALLRQQNLSWNQARLDSKVARRVETDTIHQFINYATAQGSQNAQMYYVNITKMTYRSLFLVKQSSPKPFRDMLDAMQLSFLTTAEYVAQKALEDGMEGKMFYKDIYQLARDRVETFSRTLPQSRLLAA